MSTKFYFGKLSLKIIVMAHKGEGESILFYIDNGHKIVYSGLVDSYYSLDKNYIEEFLSSLEISKLDFLCWTHPHDDHSVGLDNVLCKYIDNKTLLVYPSDLLSINKNHLSETSNGIIDMIREFNSERINGVNRPNIKTASGSKLLERMDFGMAQGSGEYVFRIESVSPIDQVVQNIKVKKNDKINLNKYSIFLIIRFGQYSFLLTSDIEEASINRIDDFLIPKKVHFLKVPHHGSESSIKIIDFAYENQIDINDTIACVTEFYNKKIPNSQSLKKYGSSCSELFYCNDRGVYDYGYFSIEIDLLRDKIDKEVHGIFDKYQLTS